MPFKEGNTIWLGRKHSEETKRRISDATKGKHPKSEYKTGNTIWLGRKHSEDSKNKMSATRIENGIAVGEKNPMFGKAPWNKGKHLSEETKKKISISNKGHIPWINGNKHSEESIMKMSEAKRGKPNLKIRGDRNVNWNGGRKAYKARRRSLGFIPLNECDDDSWVGHHLDKKYVLYIPEELHTSIGHKQSDQTSMDVINEAAIDWYIKYYGLI